VCVFYFIFFFLDFESNKKKKHWRGVSGAYGYFKVVLEFEPQVVSCGKWNVFYEHVTSSLF
jgi:hypothetical protein